MSDHNRRKELKDAYRARARAAGVYRIVNTKTNKYLLATSANLDKIEKKALVRPFDWQHWRARPSSQARRG